jgi:3-oxoacyl-[acyl-carrier protein] reductase
MSNTPLKNRVALVTGASKGIGAAIARSLSEAGARVVLTYRSGKKEAEALAAELGDCLALELDVTSLASIQTAFEACDAHFGPLDILVNNAGYLKQEPFFEITEESYDTTLDTNLKGLFFCTQAAGRRFAEKKSGCVINIASVGGQFGGPKAPHYSASKAAVITLTKSCARILGPLGARANCISPGFIRTEMIAHLLGDGQEEEIAAGLPIGRVGETSDIGSAAVYLASDESSFMTGHTLNINGGQFM